MPRQFGIPEELITDVCTKALPPHVYAKYMKEIQEDHSIGVNNVYMIADWIDVEYFGDCGWYKVHQMKLAKWAGLKVTSCTRFQKKSVEESEGIRFLKKDHDKRLGLTEDKTKLCWNHNSGAAAINLATHLGVKQIRLLGFDMKSTEHDVSHWHGNHGNKRQPPYARHLKGFPQIATDAEEMGVEILNVNPDSAIEAFPKVTLEELL
jgi:hypothetical protein